MSDISKQAEKYEKWIEAHRTEYDFLLGQVMSISKDDPQKLISLNDIITNHNINVTHNARAYILRRIEQDCEKEGMIINIYKGKSKFDELFQHGEPHTFSDFMKEKESVHGYGQNLDGCEVVETEHNTMNGVLSKLARKFKNIFSRNN